MKLNSPESRRWLQLRRNLFKQVETQVQEHLGGESIGLARYRREYEKEFKRKWKIANRGDLLKAVEEARFVFLGDFHALQQSQKAQLRILKNLKKASDIILAVEFFEAKNQIFIDEHLKGKISEKQLLSSIGWRKNWGFPWDHYRPLVRWASKKKIPIFGINLKSDGHTERTLHERDQFSAAKISELRKLYPEKKIVVIFGDLHLASQHLLCQVSKNLNKSIEKDSVTIFQNSESVYFELLEKGMELQVDVVQLRKGKYCILSVPPWVKWQNYLLYLEQTADFNLREEDLLDPTDQVAKYVEIIAHDLGVEVNLNQFSVESAFQPEFWSRLKSRIDKKELIWYQTYIQTNRSFYLPHLQLGYLARLSVNHAAALAALIVYSQINRWRHFSWRMPQDFLCLIWLEAVQFFGSKMINPKRKSDTILDIKAALSSKLPEDRGREALRLALSQKMQEILFLIEGRTIRKISKFSRGSIKKNSSYVEAAQLLGAILGEKLYHAYRKGLLSKEQLLKLLQRPLGGSRFKESYYEILKIIESFPEPFASKTDRL